VTFVNEKQPALGAVLEHGSPLKQEAGVLEIGFPEGSYFLSSLQDAETLAEVKALASGFYGQETVIRVKPIAPETGDIPLSLAEKKKSDFEQRQKELRQEVAGHPVINEALRIFCGTITDIREV
jgi:DNA polymerase-3 subunit gamma/tau